MTDNINKLMAEALVRQGYAKGVLKLSGEYRIYVGEAMGSTMDVSVDPFADTLEGRRQLEALFDYFAKGMSPICHFDYQCLIPIGLQMRTFVTKCIEDAEKSHD